MAISRTMPAALAGGRSRHRIRRRSRRTHPWQVAAALCLLAGLLLIDAFAYGMWKGVAEEERLTKAWTHEIITRIDTSTKAPQGIDTSLQHPVNGVDFAIRVPKLHYFAAVKEGTDSGILYASPGHYPATKWPGSPGTVGVAAHNVYWIDFPQLARGDEVDIETRYGLYRYMVTGSEIVNPDNRTVLVPNSNGYPLTLTTCWPLWAGAFARQRYVVFADQIWPVPVKPDHS